MAAEPATRMPPRLRAWANGGAALLSELLVLVLLPAEEVLVPLLSLEPETTTSEPFP